MSNAARIYGMLVATLADRTARLVQGETAQRACARQLDEARRLLDAQQAMLAQCNADLVARDADLVATRALLVERTERFKRVNTAALAQCEVVTSQLNAELLTMREVVAERTQQLAQSGIDAQAVMGELDVTHGTLIERTSRLEQCAAELADKKVIVMALQTVSADLSARLGASTADLQGCSAGLSALQAQLEKRTGEFSRLRQTSLMGEGQLRANEAELALREKALTATTSQLFLAHELLQVASRQLDLIRRFPFKFALSSQVQVILKRFHKR